MNYKIIYPFIFLITLLSISQINSQEYWLRTNSPTNQTLRRLSFVDNLTGWAAGYGGTIIKTSDGGEHWEIQNSTVETNIVDIFFLNVNRGWALTWTLSGTVILKTENGGEHWTAENYPENNKFMWKIFFKDSLNGLLGGQPNAFVYTNSGGIEWNEVTFDSGLFSNFPVLNFSFYNEDYGFANGGTFDIVGVIWKTTNGGKNWTSMGVGPEPIQKIVFFDSLNVLAVGGDFEYGTGIVRTNNGGQSWEYTSLGVAGIAFGISFRTPNEGWACLGSAEKFIVTIDSGLTWTPINTPDGSKIYDIVFTDSLHGYAIGETGTILKYDTTVVKLPDLNHVISPIPYILYQNYPNPFNPNTTISYKLTKTSQVVLTIYNITGQKVKVLVNERQMSGDYQVQWNGRDESGTSVSSGIYFYQLLAENKTDTKKMVLIR